MIFKRFKNKKRSGANYGKYTNYRRNQKSSGFKGKVKPGKTKRRRTLDLSGFKKVGLILLALILLSTGIYYIFFTENLILKETALFEGKERIDHDIILSEINVHKGEPILSINKQELILELKAKYPEIETIRIRKKLPSKMEVYITKYPVVANLVVSLEDIERKYLVNSRGAIDTADKEDPALPYIKVTREKAYNSKEVVFEEKDLTSILKAIALFEQKFSMQVREVKYLEEAREYHLLTENNFYIWMDLTQDHTSQLSKLKAAEQKLNIHTTPLQYIDLRVAGTNGEKVIYK